MTRKSKSEIIIRIIGIALALGGITLAIIGISELFADKIDMRDNLFWLAMIGIPMFGLGLMLTILSFRRRIMERTIKKNAEILSCIIKSSGDEKNNESK